MERWLFFLCMTFVRVDAKTKISADGKVWHYTPESQTTHWLFPSDIWTDLVLDMFDSFGMPCSLGRDGI